MHQISGIILAGGKSTRFSTGNKQFTLLNNKPLLYYSLHTFTLICTHIFVSVHTETQGKMVESIIKEYFPSYSIKIIYDANEFAKFEGPIVGILSAIQTVQSDYLLFTPADAPFISDTMYKLLLEQLATVDLATFIDLQGYITTLTFALHKPAFKTNMLLQLYKNKQDLPLRVTDLFLTLRTLNFVRYLHDVPQLLNINVQLPQIQTFAPLPNFDIIHIKNKPTTIVTSKLLPKLLSIWKDTMLAHQLTKDYLAK